MLDNFLSQLRRGAGQLQRRSEEMAQGARIRVEVYQLARELDGTYARLGRAYHAGADSVVLQDLRGEVQRLDEEIAAREKLLAELAELSAAPEEAKDEAAQAPAPHRNAALAPAGPSNNGPEQEANLGDLPDAGDLAHPVPPSDAPPSTLSNAPTFVERETYRAAPTPSTSASHVWRSKEEQRMTDNSNQPPRSDDPVIAHSDTKLVPGDNTASMGKEAARDQMARHENTLKEGEAASKNPDPLDK